MKLFFALVLTFALCGPAFAQDSKVSDMTSTTSVDGNDEYLYIVEDISGTPLSRRVKPKDLIQQVTFANLPAAGTPYRLRWVTDCTSTTSCTAGGGAAKVLHFDDGTSWVPIYAIITAANVTYTPTTGADWDDPDPQEVKDALDTLAAVGKLTTTSAGAPGVTDCLSTKHYIVDTSTPELYFCPSGAGSAPVKVHAKSIGLNQINGDSGSFTLPAGGGPATLSGGTGLTNTCATATCTMEIDANAITFAKMQAITDNRLLGASGGTAVEEISVGTGLSLSSNSLDAATGVKTKSITFRIGSDSGSVLADTADELTMWRNNIAAMTITEVWCESDAGTPSINLQRDDGSAANILSSNLTCTTSGATGTIDTNEDNLAAGDKIDFVMVTAGGSAKRVTVNIKATLD